MLSLMAFSQTNSIQIGKRKNIIWDRAIQASNLGSIYNYYYPIYFKTTKRPYFVQSGILGEEIKQVLNLDLPKVSAEFDQYRKDKKVSYLLLGSAIASLGTWTYLSADYLSRNEDQGFRAFFKPKPLIFLGAYCAGISYSIHLNLKGDKHLRNAVFHHNKSISIF